MISPTHTQVALGLYGQCNAQASKVAHWLVRGHLKKMVFVLFCFVLTGQCREYGATCYKDNECCSRRCSMYECRRGIFGNAEPGLAADQPAADQPAADQPAASDDAAQ